MTERLSQLLHDEAAELHPAPPDAALVLAEGRRLRRRARLTSGLAAGAVVAVVAASGGIALSLGDSGDGRPGPATTPDSPVVFAVGSTVYVDDTAADVPDTVHSLHYTSVGVLVRSNPNGGASDGSGPESLTLVTPRGDTVDLGTVPEGVGPATDPTESVYVLAEARGDGFVAVVRDAETGETVDEVALPDLPPSYWDVPPLALDGGTLYAGFKKETVAIDLGTGDPRTVEGLEGGLPDVQDGRSAAYAGEGRLAVVDTGNGATLLTVESESYLMGSLSPDGRYLQVVAEGSLVDGEWVEPDSFDVYDVATQARVTIDRAPYGWGWTADGELFNVAGDTVTTCDGSTGQCSESAAPTTVGNRAVPRLGGRVYES